MLVFLDLLLIHAILNYTQTRPPNVVAGLRNQTSIYTHVLVKEHDDALVTKEKPKLIRDALFRC